MQLLAFLFVSIILTATFFLQKSIKMTSKPMLISALAMIVIALPTYLFFGAFDYRKTDSEKAITFEQVSPEQNAVLQTFENLKSSRSVNVTAWENSATALRLGRRYDDSSFAYAKAASLVDAKSKKAALFGAAGEALVERDAGSVSSRAYSFFENALRFDDKDLGAHYYLGQANEAAQNNDLALNHYRAFLVNAGSGHPRAADIQAKIFTLSGQAQPKRLPTLTPERIAEFDALSDAQKDEFIGSMLSRRFNRLKTEGGTASQWRDLARLHLKNEDKEGALKAYAEALKKDPENDAIRLEMQQITP